jgi:DNA-binding transcriptional regulator YhcF (GntR family)
VLLQVGLTILSGKFMALYEEVADHLQHLIRQGVYCPGDKLPSIRKLAAHRSV